MKFHTLSNAPVRRDDLVFKQSSVKAAIPVTVLWGIAVAALLAGLKVIPGSNFPAPLGWVIGVGLGLFGLVFFAQFRATIQPTNWLLRSNQTGVLVKYRSYLNRKLPATDLQVVQFDYSEIAWARKAVERRTTLSMDSNNSRQSQTIRYLDLCLTGEASALNEKLQAENVAESKATSHWGDFPVQLLDGGIVRIRWNGTTPNLDHALKELGRHHVKLKEADASKADYATVTNLSEEELKEKVRKLAATGDEMAACELVKKAQRCSTTEAVHFVDKVKAEVLSTPR